MLFLRQTNDYFTYMDTHTYNCEYCHEEYIPRRRHAQKYCSNSCRSKAYHIRNRDKKTTDSKNTTLDKTTNQRHTEDKNSDVKNFLINVGAELTTRAILSVFTKDENKAVTRKDFRELLALQTNRFHKVYNLPNEDGKAPYFDTYTGNIVYKKEPNAFNFLPG